jgi:peptidyl-prolyl cis-trans isomerase SurA
MTSHVRLRNEYCRGWTMRWLMIVLLAGISTLGAAQSDRARVRIVPLDRIVAVVNTEVITRTELDDRIRLVLQQLRQQKIEPPTAEILERQILERMIADRAQLQFAKDAGLRIDEQQLDRAMERIATSNGMSLADFRRSVEQDGVPFERLREDVRTEMTVQRLREREVESRIQVSESEIDNHLADEANASDTTTEFNLSHVLVRVPDGAGGDQLDRLQARARSAHDELRKGGDFSKVAIAYSDAPDGLEGGAMGWRARERLPELFVEAIARMKPGDFSEVMRSPAGFHIVKLIDRRGVKNDSRPIEQTRARHILVKANEVVSEIEARRRIDRLRQRVTEGAAFEEIARFNSEDASAARGGELGWVYPGDTVPEFEGAMSKLKPGELSAPIRTPFGWHLIQVLERRTGELSSDRRRIEARKVLRDRKADEVYEEWLRQLRDRAYVEYRLDER